MRADPTATSVDEAAGVVPAVTLTVPVETQSDFPATGKRVEKHPAKGAVKWTNCDPTSPYRIPSGTVVKTASGTAFTTDEEVFLPVAILSGGGASPSLDCQTSEVAVTAVVPGPDGNVDAGTIRVVPARYNRNVLRVNNPAPTTGGTREEFTRVSQKDVDAALAKLDADLQDQFATEVQHPSDVPEGTTPFPETAVLGESTPSVDPQTLVGQEVDSFTLGLTADGTVLAADASPAEAIGEQRLQASVAEGRELVPGSTSVEIGDGTVVDGRIEFPVTASANQVRPLDAAALERTVLGLPIEQAKAALQPYGDVVIDPWPSWVTSVPSLEQRVILTVGQPVARPPRPGHRPSRPTRRRRARWRFPRARRRARSAAAPGASRYHPPDEPHPGNRPRRAADRARRGRIGDRRRPAAVDDRPRQDDRCRRRGAGSRLPRAGRHGAGRRAADRGGGPGGHDGRGRPGVGHGDRHAPRASRSRCATSGCPRSRPSGALGRMPRGRSGGAPSRAQRNAYRARIDREAAAVILQDELDARQEAR